MYTYLINLFYNEIPVFKSNLMSDHIEEGQVEFRVFVCKKSTSPSIQQGIWDSQHICVSDEPKKYFSDQIFEEMKISPEKAGDAVIRHQLKVEHFGVLRQAFIKFKCYGFPHSTMTQITRHEDTAPLVTSMRFTGEKFIQVVDELLLVEDRLPVDRAFYVRPEGVYRDRTGRQVEWTKADKLIELNYAYEACERYKGYVRKRGMPFEMAREFLPYCYRQPFAIAGTIEAFFHWVDQRSKADSEREIQILAELCMKEFKNHAPQLHDWYMDNRWGKARLAP